jgi:hypothetical protein
MIKIHEIFYIQFILKLHAKCLNFLDLSVTFFFLPARSTLSVQIKLLLVLSYRARSGTRLQLPQTHYGGGVVTSAVAPTNTLDASVFSFPHKPDGQVERTTRQVVSGGGGDSGGEGCQGRSRGGFNFADARVGTSAPSASTPHSTTTTVSLGFHCPPSPIICSSF